MWPLAALQPRAVLRHPACPGLRPLRRSSARAQSACPTAPAPRLTPHGVLSLCGRALALLGSFCFLLPVIAELMHTHTHTHTHIHTDTQRHTYTEPHTPLPVMAELMLTQAHTRTRGMRSDERPPREAAARVRVRFSEHSSDNIRAYDPALPSGRRGRAGPAGGTVKSLGALQLRPTASAPSVQGLRTHVPPQTPH